jgi:hypothetical protein
MYVFNNAVISLIRSTKHYWKRLEASSYRLRVGYD